MSLTAITDRDQIANAFIFFQSQMNEGGAVQTVNLGWPGGQGIGKYEAVWRADVGIWFVSHTVTNGHWFGFGLTPPWGVASVAPVVQFGLPLQGIDRRCGGLFATDGSGGVWALHSGKLGGGRPGVSKTGFVQYNHRTERVNVRFPDGLTSDYFVMGLLGSPELPYSTSRYVAEVQAFKAHATSVSVADTN